MLWNRAAEAITGYASADLLSRQAPEPLEPLLAASARLGEMEPDAGGQLGHRTLVHALHKLGHDVPVMARYFVLRDGMGGRMGMAVLFHPADSLDALPHGECDQGGDLKASQAVLEDRLATMFGDFTRGGQPFGVLWITVDQAARAAQDARRQGLRGDAGKGGAGDGQRAAAGRGDGALGRR